MRIQSLKDLQYRISDIPSEVLLHHASTDDISRWLYSRALFPIADVVKSHRFYSLDEVLSRATPVFRSHREIPQDEKPRRGGRVPQRPL